MNKALEQYATEIFKELKTDLSEIADDKINKVPYEGSWTAGQLVEHLIKATSGLAQLNKGRTADPQRNATEKIEPIKKLFLDFSTKMKSPDFIKPSEQIHDKRALILSLEEIEHQTIHTIQTQDLDILCLDMEMPGFGQLTINEWVSFALIHIQRHIQQLKKIAAAL